MYGLYGKMPYMYGPYTCRTPSPYLSLGSKLSIATFGAIVASILAELLLSKCFVNICVKCTALLLQCNVVHKHCCFHPPPSRVVIRPANNWCIGQCESSPSKPFELRSYCNSWSTFSPINSCILSVKQRGNSL